MEHFRCTIIFFSMLRRAGEKKGYFRFVFQPKAWFLMRAMWGWNDGRMFVFYIMVYKWGMGGGGAIMGGLGVSTTTLRGASLGDYFTDWLVFASRGDLLSFFSFEYFFGRYFLGSFLLSYHREWKMEAHKKGMENIVDFCEERASSV